MTTRRLSTKFLILGLVLLALAMLSIAATMWVTHRLDGGAAAVNEAGRLRMQAWRMLSAETTRRDAATRTALLNEFDRTLQNLRDGVPARPLAVPWSDETIRQFAQLEQGWMQLRQGIERPDKSPGELAALSGEVDRFVQEVDTLVLGMERVMVHLAALLTLFQFVMMALAVAGALLAMYMGYLFVISPIRRLRDGLRRVQAGHFDVRIEAHTHDEFGELASGFNHMARNLGALYHELELQVQAKTRDLQAERARLRVLYEVSNFLIDARTMEEVGRGFAQKVREVAQADAVAVRWSDEASQRYLMLGSDRLPEELVNEERCIEAGLCACGQPAQTARTRVIPILSEEDRRLGACARAGYLSLVSVPVRMHDRVLGEVDLFFRCETTLSVEDRALYDALAGHLARALENLRAEALLREAAVSEERGMIARELHDSIAQSLSFLRIQVSLLRQALERSDRPQIDRVVDEIDTGVRECTSDVRELLIHFRTRTGDGGIEQAVRVTLKKFEQQTGMKAHLEMLGHGVELPSDVQLQVLHVLQEALSNVRKHANASAVWVTVERGPAWRFRVRDNGRGFDSVPVRLEDTHVGLQIMRERAERIGGRVQVHSGVGQGTEICLEVQE